MNLLERPEKKRHVARVYLHAPILMQSYSVDVKRKTIMPIVIAKGYYIRGMMLACLNLIDRPRVLHYLFLVHFIGVPWDLR